MAPTSLCKARKKRDAALQTRRARQGLQEKLRTNLTLGLRIENKTGHPLGPHFAWAFLDPEWIKDLMGMHALFLEASLNSDHVQELVFRDYLIHYATGDLGKSEQACQINDELDEVGFSTTPISWDREDDVPNYRNSPEDSFIILNQEGVHWRIPLDLHVGTGDQKTGITSFYLNTHTVPIEWFEHTLKSLE
jgi:hypothetical protein